MHYLTVVKQNSFFADMRTIWKNTDGCTEKYFCATLIYLLSILAHEYNIKIDRCVVEPGRGREVVQGFNATNKRFISVLITTDQLTGVSA